MIKVYGFDDRMELVKGLYVFVEGIDVFGVDYKYEKFVVGEVDENEMVMSLKVDLRKDWVERMIRRRDVEGNKFYKMKIKEVKERVEEWKVLRKEVEWFKEVIDIRGKVVDFVDFDVCEVMLLEDVKVVEVY